MNTKDYLSQAFRLDQRISAKLEQVCSLRKLMKKATTSLQAGGPIVKILDLEQEVDGDIDRLIDLKREIMGVISAVEQPEHQVLLELRYLSFLTLEEIAERMNYSTRQIYRIHGQAIKELEKGKTPYRSFVK